MRVISCILTQHNLFVVGLCAVMCFVGAFVTTNLLRRGITARGLQRHAWQFLVAVCSGSSIWATHFIAMLAYQPVAPVTLDPLLTLASILVVIVGMGTGFAIAIRSGRRDATLVSGGCVGLSIAAMHFVGMFAYRVDGVVSWDDGYIVAAILFSVVLSTAAVAAARRWTEGRFRHVATGLLVLAIVGLHFIAMAAFSVAPMPGVEIGANSDAFRAMALAILLVGVGIVVVGTGISSYLIDDRTRATSGEQLHQMAFHDSLTGLANRRALHASMDERFESEPPFVLMLIDLDHFKTVNDTYGHVAGDGLLVAAARRLLDIVGPQDFTARIDGDELAVVVHGDIEIAEALCLDLRVALSTPFDVEGHALTISCSVGLCARDDAKNPESMMRHADLALYEAKRGGRNRTVRFEAGLLEATTRRHGLLADVRTALALEQFHLVFQPIVDLSTRRTIGYEALIRWEHPILGLVSPAEFIPAAEENGSIVEIGGWVLAEACRAARRWPGDLYVAVNVSAVQFRSPLLLAHVTRALADSGLLATRLEIELTETAVVADGSGLATVLSSLRLLGIKIAMDDFGTGFSSLAHLKDLPLDRIKIDRTFVVSAASDRNAMAVLRAIMQIGRDMGIKTVGEGVETAEQLQLLTNLGCDAVQGYLTGRPARERRECGSDRALLEA